MKLMENINTRVFYPALFVIIFIIIPLYLYPIESSQYIDLIFNFITKNLGWLYRIACIICFAFIFWVSFGKRGDIVIGDTNKPEYKTFTWIAMLFTAGVGTSIIILGFLEPIYYIASPPFSLEPFSYEAYEYAHMYGQFHWGLSAWTFYVPAITAVGISIYNKKQNSMNLSSACGIFPTTKRASLVCSLIDIIVVFGIVGSISTSLGLATPVLGGLLKFIFNIPDEYTFLLNLVVIIIWMLIFTTSLFYGLERGMRKLSNFNVYIALLFMLIIFLYGPSVQMINTEINSLGIYLQEFIRLNMWTDPYAKTGFAENWTIFYWGWWLAFMPMMGLFIARISKGRTIRQIVWGQMFWGSLGCCLSFAIFGGYALHLQFSGQVELSHILLSQGQTEAIIAILSTFPFKKVIMLVMVILCLIYLSTTIDSCAYVLASTTTKKLTTKEQPARWNRIFWAIVFCSLSIGLMIIGGLKSVQTIAIITGLPMCIVMLLLIRFVYNYMNTLFNNEPQKGKTYSSLP